LTKGTTLLITSIRYCHWEIFCRKGKRESTQMGRNWLALIDRSWSICVH